MSLPPSARYHPQPRLRGFGSTAGDRLVIESQLGHEREKLRARIALHRQQHVGFGLPEPVKVDHSLPLDPQPASLGAIKGLTSLRQQREMVLF
jgi:hypothetical protein